MEDVRRDTAARELGKRAVAVESGCLVGVLAVAKAGHQFEGQRQRRREFAGMVLLPEPFRHLAVIARTVLEGGAGEVPAHHGIDRVRVKRVEDPVVVRGIGHDEHVVVILSRSPEHRRAADINVLHALFERDACFGDRAFEGVKVADDHVDRPDAVGGNCLHVRG